MNSCCCGDIIGTHNGVTTADVCVGIAFRFVSVSCPCLCIHVGWLWVQVCYPKCVEEVLLLRMDCISLTVCMSDLCWELKVIPNGNLSFSHLVLSCSSLFLNSSHALWSRLEYPPLWKRFHRLHSGSVAQDVELHLPMPSVILTF